MKFAEHCFRCNPQRHWGRNGMSHFFFQKILAYCWARCYRCCSINPILKEVPSKDELYSYRADSKKEQSTTHHRISPCQLKQHSL